MCKRQVVHVLSPSCCSAFLRLRVTRLLASVQRLVRSPDIQSNGTDEVILRAEQSAKERQIRKTWQSRGLSMGGAEAFLSIRASSVAAPTSAQKQKPGWKSYTANPVHLAQQTSVETAGLLLCVPWRTR